jgi:integrase/recombinase XerD
VRDERATRSRNLGSKLQGVEQVLRNFVAFAHREKASYITVDLALRWTKQSAEAKLATRAWRFQMVRHFALWRRATDPRTQVPPDDLLPHSYHRKPPYIYSDEEIDQLLRAARELPSSMGLRRLTYSTLFGLLSVTGMRVSEALALDRDDVDQEEAVLTIRRTKFGKSRLIPLHGSACKALAEYAEERDGFFPRPITPAFFISERGTRVTVRAAQYNFAKVSCEVGLRPPMKRYRHGRGPRLHDMRHRFATRTLIDWYRDGVDVEREIPRLATYLGHVHMRHTYWYLEAVPELLALATLRLDESEKEVEP